MKLTVILILWAICGLAGNVWTAYLQAQKSGKFTVDDLLIFVLTFVPSCVLGPFVMIAILIESIGSSTVLWRRKEPPDEVTHTFKTHD